MAKYRRATGFVAACDAGHCVAPGDARMGSSCLLVFELVNTVAASRGGLDGARLVLSSLSLRLPMFVVPTAGGLLVGDLDRIGAMLMLKGDWLCSYFGAPMRRETVSFVGTGIMSNGRLREWSKWRRRDERI